MNALPLVAAGAALLLLSSRKRASAAAPSEASTEEEVERIVSEAKEIVRGERDAFSDSPDTKVSPREAAERVKETLDTKATTQAGEDAAALAAARAAAEQEALAVTHVTKPSKPTTKPTGQVTMGPIGVSIPVKHAQQWLNYLGARLTVDGKYGPKTKAAWASAAASRGHAKRFDRGSPTSALVDAGARDAIRSDAANAKEAQRPIGGKTVSPMPVEPAQPAQPVQVVPAGPVPPEGFDRGKAANAAPDVARHIKQTGYDYSRKHLKGWQKLAGIAQDGIYGRGSAAALRYYVGSKAPKALFAQGEDHYPWGD